MLLNFISKLINTNSVENGCTLEKTFLDDSKLKDFASRFELIKELDNINGSALVSLDKLKIVFENLFYK